jgi:DNA-binding transcriptional ArsR family regulator
MAFVVLYDACVLYPAPLRDLLIRIANTGIVRARWTDAILDECFRSILGQRPDLKPEALKRTRELMKQAVPDCLVTGFETLIDGLSLPDKDDRHVLAAAIRAGAQTIVTFNLVDFPDAKVAPYGVEAKHPDDFVLGTIDLAPGVVAKVVSDQAGALKNPPRTVGELLDTLRAQGLVRSVARLRELFGGGDRSLRVVEGGGLKSQRITTDTEKPFVSMGDHESQRAWDDLERRPDSLARGILDDCRRGDPTTTVVAVSTQLLTLSSGMECFFYGDIEYGDDEGRASVARSVRSIGASRLMKAGESTTRIMLKTRVADLVVSREDDPIRTADAKQAGTTNPTDKRVDQKRWLADARRRKETVVRVSLGVVTHAKGERRAYSAHVEFGDGEARSQVARDIRQLRRLGLLEAGERVERYLLEVPLSEGTAKLTADLVSATPAGPRSRPRP